MKKLLLSLVITSSVVVVNAAIAAAVTTTTSVKATTPSSNTNVFIEPQAGETPIVNLINAAKQSIAITIYELDDQNIQNALNAAANRGVKVQIIYSNRTEAYETMAKTFCNSNLQISCQRASGIDDKSTYNVPYGFYVTHEKSLLIDNSIAVIMTLNMVKNATYNYFGATRDFGVITNDPADVASLANQFTSDWANATNNGSNFPVVDSNTRLFFSPSRVANPADSYNALAQLINQASKSIDIYAENFSDTNRNESQNIVKLLNAKAKSGVIVRIIAANSKVADLDPAVQIIQPLAAYPLYFHAKSIMIDGVVATVMSVNYSNYSINQNREAGIILSDKASVSLMEDTFNQDWQALHNPQ